MGEFKERLRAAIKESGLRQSEIVERSGISKSSLSEYLAGKYLAKQDNVFRLAAILNVNEAWLMGYDVQKDRVTPITLNAPARAARLSGAIFASKDEDKINLTLELLEKISKMNHEQLQALSVLLRTIK